MMSRGLIPRFEEEDVSLNGNPDARKRRLKRAGNDEGGSQIVVSTITTAAGGVTGFEFGVDPNLDPELALALRISLEEERARREAPAVRAIRKLCGRRRAGMLSLVLKMQPQQKAQMLQLLIILSGSLRRPSFLHVYHHATVVIMCYIWLETAQSLFPVALVTNATVHTVMYSYYLLSGIGIRPRWKRAVTDCQIAQFVFSFLVSGVMLWYHFGSEAGCSGFKGWCFNASLLYLFLDFHSKNYKAEQGQRHMRKKDD
ncbi:hypothetical protein Droror1_Dr00009214 [Drosera rotundifolia]